MESKLSELEIRIAIERRAWQLSEEHHVAFNTANVIKPNGEGFIGEHYIFIYDDTSRAETLRTLGRFASNPELSFTWYDAAVLAQKFKQTA